jgi:hypothetical protein
MRRAALTVFALLTASSVAAAPPVTPSPPPAQMRVALFVDTSEAASPALSQIRDGVAAFIDALPPETEVVLVSTGRRVQVRVPPTTDHKKLKSAASGLLSDGGPTPLLDALLEVDDRFMKKSDRPIFVIVTGDGSESSVRVDDKAFNRWLSSMAARHITVHGILLKSTGTGMPETITNAAVKASGGHYDVMSNGKALPEKLKALAELIAGDRERD